MIQLSESARRGHYGHMRTTLDGALIAGLVATLAETAPEPSPVDSRAAVRQPVHTCLVPVEDATDDMPARWGALAAAALAQYAPDPAALAGIVGLPPALATTVYERVCGKLATDPVEDVRIDLSHREHDTGDADAARAAELLARWCLPESGIRVRSFATADSFRRAVRSLDLAVTSLGRPVTLTLPEVTWTEQVSVMVGLLEVLERRLGLPDGALRFEIGVDTARAVVDHVGGAAVPALIAAGEGRVSGLVFGADTYAATCGLTDASADHPACDFARHLILVGAAGSGVRLCDSPTTLLPTEDAVAEGWRRHYQQVRRSLALGFPQGVDIHPAQLVARYAAVFTHRLETHSAESLANLSSGS
ncbi:Citrate lyase beta subunit [Actinokineospora diospyrosa]|uniref:Citrate lyase beta subunit n=2 Tax=Actinokineospora diospyrosa TaxID=103728 RepID=A0ABT1IMC3_9PSEU|nr:Citrate lyase beta subunit [Actinokineospora diospyrosa]